MKKGDVIRQKCVNTTFYLTGILAHKVNNTNFKVQTILSETSIERDFEIMDIRYSRCDKSNYVVTQLPMLHVEQVILHTISL